MHCRPASANSSWLQELWNIDQRHSGAKPLLPTEQQPPGVSSFVVNEQAIQIGTRRSPVPLSKLFPGPIAWSDGQPPRTYMLFDELVRAAVRYSNAPRDNAASERSAYIQSVCDFANEVLRSKVMYRVRDILRSLRLPSLDWLNTNRFTWQEFVYRFWFHSTDCMQLTAPGRVTLPSTKDLIQRFRSSDKSPPATEVIKELIAEAQSSHKTLIHPLGNGTTPGLDQQFFDLPADKARDSLGHFLKSSADELPSYVVLLMALVDDLMLLYRLDNVDFNPPFLHLFVGDYRSSERTLGGYHFWYKAFTDSNNLDARGRIDSGGLRYDSSFSRKGPCLPEAIALDLQMQLSVPGENRVLVELRKQKCGFFNGCSPEGLMALCMVAHYAGNHAGKLHFRGHDVGLFVNRSGGSFVSAYPEI